MSSYCAECHTTDKLIWIDELDDYVCQSCLVLAYTSLAESVNKREAAERTSDELRSQLATVTAERDELKRKYDRACNYDFLNEALNSGDGVYRP